MEEERGPLARRQARISFHTNMQTQENTLSRPSCLRWVSWVREAGGRVSGFSWARGSFSSDIVAADDADDGNLCKLSYRRHQFLVPRVVGSWPTCPRTWQMKCILGCPDAMKDNHVRYSPIIFL